MIFPNDRIVALVEHIAIYYDSAIPVRQGHRYRAEGIDVVPVDGLYAVLQRRQAEIVPLPDELSDFSQIRGCNVTSGVRQP